MKRDIISRRVCFPNNLHDVPVCFCHLEGGVHRRRIPLHIPTPVMPRCDDIRAAFARDQVTDILLWQRNLDVDVFDTQSQSQMKEVEGFLD